jgi:hypothetical protein
LPIAAAIALAVIGPMPRTSTRLLLYPSKLWRVARATTSQTPGVIGRHATEGLASNPVRPSGIGVATGQYP